MKLNWKWPVLVISGFLFMFYCGYTNNIVLTMRHISLGQPDPWYFFIGGFIIMLAFWFSFVAIWQNKSTEICHNIGSTCVNTLDPIALVDILDYRNTENPADYVKIREWTDDAIKKSWKYKDYLSPEEIANRIVEDDDFNLQEYQSGVNFLKPIGIYPDGGLKILGVQGLRWWIGGTSVLVVSPEYIKPHGDGGVCVASLETFSDLDQLQNLPKGVVKAVYDNIPQFVPGKHTILYGHNPHEKAVRARIEANSAIKDDELHTHPKYVWTLGVKVKTVDSDKRDAWLAEIETKLQGEVSEQDANLKKWEEHELKKKEQPPEREAEEVGQG